MIIFCLGCKAKGLKPTHTRPPFRITTEVQRASCPFCRNATGAIQVVYTSTKLSVRDVFLARVVER